MRADPLKKRRNFSPVRACSWGYMLHWRAIVQYLSRQHGDDIFNPAQNGMICACYECELGLKVCDGVQRVPLIKISKMLKEHASKNLCWTISRDIREILLNQQILTWNQARNQ